ncbi:MAG: hypothetical protein IJI45_16625 [Anaerolineaceae bacterium]|nr:hypothetical protein [Anaerolineaceae bacterium]
MSKKTVYVEDVVEALKELTAKEEFYVDPAESMFKMLEDLPSARCSDCITNGGDFECDRVHCHKGTQPPIKPVDYRDCAMAMMRMWMDNVVKDGEYYRIMDKLNKFWGKTDNE